MMAKALLIVNADPQIRDSNGQTALEIAIEQGFTEAAVILKAECVPGYSLHALEFAIREGDKKGAIAAFDGCPMDLTKSDALIDAVKRNFIEVVEELIAYGADVNQFGNGKHNVLPLRPACEHGSELIKILLAAGADPNKIGGEYLDYPSAYRCVEYDNADGLRALIAGGADMKATYRGRD
jgi:ankyrin repeat protein